MNAQTENVRMLAATLGIQEIEATALLEVSVAITFDDLDDQAAQFARHIERMISRTIRMVVVNPKNGQQDFAVELVIGAAEPRFFGSRLFATIGNEKVTVGAVPKPAETGTIHPAGLLLGACYAVGAILKKAFINLPFPSPDTLEIDLADLLGDDLPLLYAPIQFDEAYLAGAGAIGNGFIYGLSQFSAHGTLHVVDDDAVSDGNLQRCVFFTQTDVTLPKAERLCQTARAIMPGILLIPHTMRLQDLPERKGGGPWLKRLIVGVDSPRARRSLQSEIPGQVYDASTTGISEVVIYFNRQPTDLACMSCLYHESPEEQAHENHVAITLGVSIEEVKQNRISEAAASIICIKYQHLDPSGLVGLAYDTLFKQLCSTGQLITPEGRQVLAPFAFVSVLAGTLLAIEFVRRLRSTRNELFNEWHVSPWANPVLRRRRRSEKNPACEFCGNPILAQVTRTMWQKN
jgi:hypothetical protein